MANGKILHSDSKGYFFFQFNERLSCDELKGADLSEHIVHRARRNTVALQVDESDLFEPIYDFIGRFPLFRECVCMSIFAEIDQRNSKRLVRTSVLSNSNTLWVKREDWGIRTRARLAKFRW